MNTYRCPDLAKLDRELVQAYRNLDDRTIFEVRVGPEDDQNQVRAIHIAMAEHRETCRLCLEIVRELAVPEEARLLSV